MLIRTLSRKRGGADDTIATPSLKDEYCDSSRISLVYPLYIYASFLSHHVVESNPDFGSEASALI